MTCFFDLPIPIRERIYRHTLVTTRIFVRPFITVEYLTNPNRASQYGVPTLSLLSVSKQVYEEAIPIYLRENTFSIVQVDVLAAASREYPRLLHNLHQIRKVEIVFDSRDYIYMAEFLSEELPAVSRHTAVDALGAMHARFEPPEPTAHRHHIENMNEYLWGRTLTFLRQSFKLSYLYVDLSRCTCIDGCCRLADQVLGWGWLKGWVRGMPDQIQLKGTSDSERAAISRILDKQHFHRRLSPGDVYELDRVTDVRKLSEYNDELQEFRLELDRGYDEGDVGEEITEDEVINQGRDR
ncbi:hypothetical protein BDV59DRAFT_196223 [Aspergillus ambiguus]|uniref:uncharacterized protein n=1 Tax=Aspergillus ambiguus TaxID=176160 RepID=UPI003CCE496E